MIGLLGQVKRLSLNVVVLLGLFITGCMESKQPVLPKGVFVNGFIVNQMFGTIVPTYGNGFFIDDNLIMTADHVVSAEVYNISICVDGIIYNIEPNDILHYADEDVAFIKINTPEVEPKIKFNSICKVLDVVYIYGLTYMQEVPFYYGGIISAVNIKPQLSKFDTLILDCYVISGNSGSIVFNKDMEIIGIVTGYVGQFCICVPSKAILRVLAEVK